MATVTMPVEQWERVRDAAKKHEPYKPDAHVGERRGGWVLEPWCAHHWKAACHDLQPGDLDPIAPDPEPSVEAMIEELVAESMCYQLTIAHWNLTGPEKWRVDCELSDEDMRSSFGETPVTALRAVYAQVMGEEG